VKKTSRKTNAGGRLPGKVGAGGNWRGIGKKRTKGKPDENTPSGRKKVGKAIFMTGRRVWCRIKRVRKRKRNMNSRGELQKGGKK